MLIYSWWWLVIGWDLGNIFDSSTQSYTRWIKEGHGDVSINMTERIVFPCVLCTYSLNAGFASCSASNTREQCCPLRFVSCGFYSMRSVRTMKNYRSRSMIPTLTKLSSYRCYHISFFSRKFTRVRVWLQLPLGKPIRWQSRWRWLCKS